MFDITKHQKYGIYSKRMLAGRGNSINTLDTYRHGLNKFARFFKTIDIELAGEEDILDFKEYMIKEGSSTAYQALSLMAVKRFYESIGHQPDPDTREALKFFKKDFKCFR